MQGTKLPIHDAAPASEDSLWARIESFSPDDSTSEFPFGHRLARDNGWTRSYATRVVEEYKRFLYLCLRAGHPVTPSDEVDQAWHLHLVYTRSYWEDFCQGIAGRQIHHGPTRGGDAEGEKFVDWYEETLDTYRRLFQAEPPRDIWPDSETRFSDVQAFERVNRSRVWVIPKPFGRPRVGAFVLCSLPLLALARLWLYLLPLLLAILVLGIVVAIFRARKLTKLQARAREIRRLLKTETDEARRSELRKERAQVRLSIGRMARSSTGNGGGGGSFGCGGCAGCGGCGGCGG